MFSADNLFAPPVLGKGQQAKTESYTQTQADALLQASRRVDWRFLLSHPNLGRLAYLGSEDRPLVEALHLLSVGFAEVETYRHWPNFEACAEIVPLDDPAAVLHVLSRRRSGGAARLKSAVGCWRLRIGLLARIVSCFSIVARRQVRNESQ
jgi:hypothetical protein